MRSSRPAYVSVWLRIGNATNRILIEWLNNRWDAVEAALADGEMLIEVR